MHDIAQAPQYVAGRHRPRRTPRLRPRARCRERAPTPSWLDRAHLPARSPALPAGGFEPRSIAGSPSCGWCARERRRTASKSFAASSSAGYGPSVVDVTAAPRAARARPHRARTIAQHRRRYARSTTSRSPFACFDAAPSRSARRALPLEYRPCAGSRPKGPGIAELPGPRPPRFLGGPGLGALNRADRRCKSGAARQALACGACSTASRRPLWPRAKSQFRSPRTRARRHR